MPGNTKDKPTIVNTDVYDDIQSMGNVEQMYTKVVKPIDEQFRSIGSSPGLENNTAGTRVGYNAEDDARRSLEGQNINSESFLESRAHAFYRMVGFPVVSQDGFYNSGHDPSHNTTSSHRSTVDDSLRNKNTDLLDLAKLRELYPVERERLFQQQDETASFYTLLMRNPKPFLMAQTGKDPFFFDPQKQPIAGRNEDIEYFKSLNVDATILSNLKATAENVPHILKPFIVIPEIEKAVTPNYKKRVCVPFLKNITETKSTPYDILKRPIIEYILRKRLEIVELDNIFISAANKAIQNTSSADASSAAIKNALLAISGETNLVAANPDVIEGIQGFTTVQSNTVIYFTKAIQAAIIELEANIRVFDEVRINYGIIPVPNIYGPEYGGDVRNGGISLIDQKIALMELQRTLAYNRSKVLEETIGNEGAFASAFVADIQKDFDGPIRSLKSERNRAASMVINSLKIMEIVTGEISGLGLIDILAIYTALWTINIEDLIGLLDNESLARLSYNFPNLVTSEVSAQLNRTRKSIFEVLTNFEKVLFNILTYADKVLVQTKQGPRRARRGIVEGT